MQHSAERVNARYQGRSMRDLGSQRSGTGAACPMTCDVITKLRPVTR